jgi:hypothetical protein
MKSHALTAIGFVLAYCAFMATIILVAVPDIDGWRSVVELDVLLPCGLIGAALIVYARWA